MSQFIPQSFYCENTGTILKHTKKKFTWVIQVDDSIYNVNIYHSLNSSEVLIVINGETVVNEMHYGRFQSTYKISIGGVKATVFQADDLRFDMWVDGRSVSDMLENYKEEGHRVELSYNDNSDVLGLDDSYVHSYKNLEYIR